MKDNRKNLVLSLINMVNVAAMGLSFAFCWYQFYARTVVHPFWRRGNWAVILVYIVLYVLFCRIYDGFSTSTCRISESVYSQALAAFFAAGVMYVVIFLLAQVAPNPLPLLGLVAVQTLLAGLCTVLGHKWYFSIFPPNRTVVVYDTRENMAELIQRYRLQKEYRVVRSISVEACLKDMSVLNRVDVVFLSGVHSHERNILLKYCVEQRLEVFVIPRVGDLIMSGARRMHMFHLPILRTGSYAPSLYYVFFKRCFDILLSFLALVLLSPLLLVTAAAIKLYDGGPVFYRQTRLTKDGKTFSIIKFRSMRVDAEKDGVARLSTGDRDERITPIGRVIRKVRLDELPQLLCILRGDMSICGPRPERPEIAEQIEKELPEFRLRLQVKAGLTGYAQVYGKYNTTPYDKLLMDLMYIANPTFLEDIRIIFATVKVLFQPESTEGVGEEGIFPGSVRKERVGAGKD